MGKDNRTIYDLSDQEYEDYQNNPDQYEDITDNTNEDALDMMYPDGEEDDWNNFLFLYS